MISDEYMLKAANRMESAAQQAANAADRMESASNRLAHLLEDGYGGNGLRLMQALEFEIEKSKS